MGRRKAVRILIPVFIAIAAITVALVNASLTTSAMPLVEGGVLNLAEWDGSSAFQIVGEWEFYWDMLLSDAQIEAGGAAFDIVEAPGEWNYYETGTGGLPGYGRATYRMRITGAQPDMKYGLRIQNMASAYRVYAEDILLGQNGSFGDKADAPVSGYRPQTVAFTAQTDSFDIILQISNDAYAMGGMWEPVVFGTSAQTAGFDRMLSDIITASSAGLLVISLFFLIFYIVRRREKDMLILAAIGVLVLLRLSISGGMFITYIFPRMPIAGFGWIDYLTLIWTQFLLLYFTYCAYGDIVRRWQVIVLLAYSAVVSLCVMALPFEVITGAYVVLNMILLFMFSLVTVQLGRAAWRGRQGAPALFGAFLFILLFAGYSQFADDWSMGYYLLPSSAIEYTLLFFIQCVIVAMRYNRAQEVELTFLKGQIHPHFIHNTLTGIAGLARTDSDRARELLIYLSSYLRGYYDYDSEELIPIEKELELVRAYAAIEQMRFGARVKIKYEIDSGLLLVPPLILQPLVENAFVHGIREKDEGGMVTVYAIKVRRNRARIGVRDNGPGLGTKPSQTGRRGVGIENINRRLSSLYQTRLVFTVPEDGGCEAYMEIPWKEAAKDENLFG